MWFLCKTSELIYAVFLSVLIKQIQGEWSIAMLLQVSCLPMANPSLIKSGIAIFPVLLPIVPENSDSTFQLLPVSVSPYHILTRLPE